MPKSRALTNEQIIIFYVGIVILYCLIFAVKKLYLKKKYNQKYLILPKLNIQTISGISMMTAMNIALIITISLLSNQIMGIFFKVYPGARFLIENILIKLGGIMFGPIIGIFIGFTTDLLTVIFTSSVLNYGYFFSAMMNGFLGGLIYQIIRINNDKTNLKKTLASIGWSLVSLFFVGVVLRSNSGGKPFQARILSFTISMKWTHLFILIFTLMACAMLILIMSTFAKMYQNDPRYNYKRWIKMMADHYMFFLILMCNCSIYLLVDMISLPMFDVKLSSLPYEQFLISRIITSIPSVILFSYLINYIYKLHCNIKGTSRGISDLVVGAQDIKPTIKKEYLPKVIH